MKAFKYCFFLVFIFFPCIVLAETSDTNSGNVVKEYILILIDFLKIPLSVLLSLWLIKGKLRLFILKDLVVKRLEEIDKIKHKVRKKALFALNEIQDLGEIPRNVFIDEHDLKYAEEVLSEIEEEAVHAEKGLASVSVISSRFFSNFKIDYNRFNRRKKGSFKVRKDEFYYLLFNSIEYIESSAARSMEVPDEISFSDKREFGKKAWPLIKKAGVGGINGVDQGASLAPYDYHCAHYFFSVFDFHIVNEFFLANKVFFSMLKDYNISYFYFIFQGWYVPDEVLLDDKPDFFNNKRALKFIGMRPSILIGGEENVEQLDIYYANLQSSYIFIHNVDAKELKFCFENLLGFPVKNLILMKDLEVVKITITKKDAISLYKKNILNISYKAYVHSEKNLLEFSVSSLKKGSPLALYVLVVILYNSLMSVMCGAVFLYEKYISPLYFFIKGGFTYLLVKLFRFFY